MTKCDLEKYISVKLTLGSGSTLLFLLTFINVYAQQFKHAGKTFLFTKASLKKEHKWLDFRLSKGKNVPELKNTVAAKG